MTDGVNSKRGAGKDYPIPIRVDDMSLSITGDLLITGPSAERVRRLLLNYPQFYIKSVVPFIRAREASFKPTELWIDPQGRIHITNRRIVQRMRRHTSLHTRDKRKRRGES